YPKYLTNTNGMLFFSADDGTNGRELWQSNGTASGTVMVQDVNPGASWHCVPGSFGPCSYQYYGPNSSSPSHLTNVSGRLYFTADDGTHGRELWQSNGLTPWRKNSKVPPTGAALVADINPSGSSSPNNLTNVYGTLYLTADDGKHGQELWTSDGTA